MIYKEDGLIQYTGNASCYEERRMTLQGDCRSFFSFPVVVMAGASFFGSPYLSLLFPFPLSPPPLFFFFFKVRSYFTSFYPGEMETLEHPEVEMFLVGFVLY